MELIYKLCVTPLCAPLDVTLLILCECVRVSLAFIVIICKSIGGVVVIYVCRPPPLDGRDHNYPR